jgi:hypothetical protein
VPEGARATVPDGSELNGEAEEVVKALTDQILAELAS